jgi:hypothetical protein
MMLALLGGVAVVAAVGLLVLHGTRLDTLKDGGFLHSWKPGFAVVIGIGALAALLLLWKRIRR